MTAIKLTCDRQDSLWRVAVWQGRDLRDLYVDRLDKPDLTGALVGAKVARLTANHKAAWCDADLDTTIYVENPGDVRSGDYLMLRITSPARQGKAWGGRVESRRTSSSQTGIIDDPPRPWERALADLKDKKPSALEFADRDDHTACHKLLEKQAPELLPLLLPLAKASPHPELDDLLESLSQPVVDLNGGGNIVVEETEALVSIDVNGGEAGNALAVNLQAVKEAARQIRWRNLSGVIMLDALKMKMRADNAKILNAAERAMAGDPARAQVCGMTKLGLIEISRQRRGPSLSSILRP